MKVIKTIKDKILFAYQLVAAITLVVLIAAAAIQVVTRYVIAQPPGWTDELARFAFVWCSALGAVVALDKGMHAGITLLEEKLPEAGRRVPVSVCGAKAKEAAELLNSHGMKFTYLSDDIGLASATKALRSVLAKGIIALVTETVFATDHYHITEEVLDKMKVTMFDERGFMGFCHYCVASAAIHNGRFCHEMEEVLKTLDDLGENSIMTQATLKKFEWLQQEGYAAYFPERAKTYDEVLAVKKMLDEKKGEKANV